MSQNAGIQFSVFRCDISFRSCLTLRIFCDVWYEMWHCDIFSILLKIRKISTLGKICDSVLSGGGTECICSISLFCVEVLTSMQKKTKWMLISNIYQQFSHATAVTINDETVNVSTQIQIPRMVTSRKIFI